MGVRGAGGAGGAGMNSVLGIPMTDIPEAPPGQKNEAFLGMLPAAQAQMVRMMDDGSLPVSGFGGFAVKDRNELLKAAAIYNPKFDARKYGIMTKTAGEFTPGGKVGNNVLAIRTLPHHIERYAELFGKLNNSQVQRWNAAKNKMATEFGDPALNNLKVPLGFVASEIARIVKGGNAAPVEDEVKFWTATFDSKSSPAQMRGVVWEALQGAGGRLEEVENYYKQIMGKEFGVITPELRELILRNKPKDAPTPSWLGGGEPKRGTKATYEQVKELVYKNGGDIKKAMEEAKKLGLEVE